MSSLKSEKLIYMYDAYLGKFNPPRTKFEAWKIYVNNRFMKMLGKSGIFGMLK